MSIGFLKSQIRSGESNPIAPGGFMIDLIIHFSITKTLKNIKYQTFYKPVGKHIVNAFFKETLRSPNTIHDMIIVKS